jgi:hypothetical protein
MAVDSADRTRKSYRRWQSDIVLDLTKRYGFPYVALNPGASYRGLHDSLVNHGEGEPPILLCNREKIAVQNESCGTSIDPTATPGASSAPEPRSAPRSASRLPTKASVGWSSTCSPTAT